MIFTDGIATDSINVCYTVLVGILYPKFGMVQKKISFTCLNLCFNQVYLTGLRVKE